jgi:hypothetical protein
LEVAAGSGSDGRGEAGRFLLFVLTMSAEFLICAGDPYCRGTGGGRYIIFAT